METTENVLERLGTTESTTLALKREDGGKIRVASMLSEDAGVILRDEVLEAAIPFREVPVSARTWDTSPSSATHATL